MFIECLFAFYLLWCCDSFPVMTSHYGSSRSHTLDKSHSVGLLWTSDQSNTGTTDKTQPSEDTNFRTQNNSKRAAADPRGWQLNNIVNYPLVLPATGVIPYMLNFSFSKLNLTTNPNPPGPESITQFQIVMVIIIITTVKVIIIILLPLILVRAQITISSAEN